MTSDLKKCFVEFFGTFFLCFTVLCCILLSVNPVLVPIAIGFVLAVLVYAGGPISGGHYNPAVSLAIFFIGRMGSKKTLLYCIFQVFGAAYAALMALLLSSVIEPVTQSDFAAFPMIIAEIVFTTLLIYTVFFTAVSKRVNGNQYFGLAIGTSVMVGVAAVGGICLAALNPAVAIAVGLLRIACFKTVIITIIADIIAAGVACGLFKLLSLDDVEKVEIVAIDEFIRQ